MYLKAKNIERLLCSRGHFLMRGLRMDRNFDGKLRPKSPNQNLQILTRARRVANACKLPNIQ